jgi:hypothetical protein
LRDFSGPNSKVWSWVSRVFCDDFTIVADR